MLGIGLTGEFYEYAIYESQSQCDPDRREGNHGT